MTTLFINNLIEEFKLMKKHNKEFETNLREMLVPKENSRINSTNKLALSDCICYFVEEVLHDALLASK
jgi:hypothetical protein